MNFHLSRFLSGQVSAAWRAGKRVVLAGLLLGLASGSLPAQESSRAAVSSQIDPLSLPITSIHDLLALPPERLPAGRVRVRATALPHRARDIIEVTDGTGTLMVQSRQPNRLPIGEPHDFVGRAIMRAGQLILDDTQFTLVRRIPTALSDDAFQVVDGLRQLQRLSTDRADGSLPVAVRGVVTYVDRRNNTLMIQDGSAGCWVGVSADQPKLSLGQELRLRGFTAPGDFAPIIIRPRIEFIGQPGLPPAAVVPSHEFAAGRFDGIRVSLEGVVRGIVADKPQTILELMSDGNRIELRFPADNPLTLPPRLLGARVRVTGVSAAHYNRFQQLGGFRLMIPDLAGVEIIEAGPEDFFALPPVTIRDLIRFDPGAPPFALKQVRGTVLFAIENQRVFLKDATGTVEAVCHDTAGVRSGDLVSVVGYPELATFGKVLRDAVIRPAGRGEDPVALPVDLASNRLELLHGELLLLDATYQGRMLTDRGTTLILRSGEKTFNAFLPGKDGGPLTDRLEEGSRLRLKGVLEVSQAGDESIIFNLILRSLADVTVIARPPWWTLARALTILGLVVLVSAVAIAWVAVQRRRAEVLLRLQEEKLRQSQKMEAIGTLAGGIAHDFNNILTGILGYTELTLMDLSPDSAHRGDLENIRQAGNRARDLVRQILTYSRRIEQPRRPVELAVIVAEVGKLLRATVPTTIYISMKLDDACPRILADATQIHQVLMNLGTNAYHATRSRGGTITIAVAPYVLESAVDLDGVHLAAGRYAELVVADDGEGMPPEVLQRIFEPYYTTRKADQGSGLGLAVVQGIVRSHGGAITATSTPGKGTAMRVLLPATDQPATETIPPEARPVRGTGRILLVDDEPMIAGLGKRMLEGLGYEVTLAFSGSEAFAAIESDPRRFDLVITDQTMPHLTGLSLLGKIRQLVPELPVIISTGYSETLNSVTARQHGARELLDKPFRQADLAAAVARVLARKF